MIHTLAVIVVAGLAAFRLARVVTLDAITEPLREWVWNRAYIGVREFAEDEEMDYEVHRQSRAWAWLYGLISCVFCASWWLALGTYAAWSAWSWSRPIIAAVAAAGVAAVFARVDVGHTS